MKKKKRLLKIKPGAMKSLYAVVNKEMAAVNNLLLVIKIKLTRVNNSPPAANNEIRSHEIKPLTHESKSSRPPTIMHLATKKEYATLKKESSTTNLLFLGGVSSRKSCISKLYIGTWALS